MTVEAACVCGMSENPFMAQKPRGAIVVSRWRTMGKECKGKKRASSYIQTRSFCVFSLSLALAFLSVVIAYDCHGLHRSLYFADLARHRVLVD